ncbi:double-strand break repair protein AddB [Acetobacter fallax]|uniref:Double-strand break repair protein AddB n=1 Tax=Acetobacter fallax TaxID=1737473 RepID=A0ABX0K987_9PROT|nr:double-strand break repair protein AddB [Acetobacter fallax]NHO32944.1 double-strand break repair protein AddB [Acetobacter fallax]NHO36565.1 double-strand break repair protein AddB [Acetobacter fallax]
MSHVIPLATIPAHLCFLDEIAARWTAGVEDDPERTGDGTLVLPGRRAARALTEAFLRHADGRAILLPRIVPIGGLDEAETALASPESLLLPPAVPPMRRLAVLTCLVLQAGEAFGTRPMLDQAWPLARALADLMDEAEWAGVDLRTVLPDAVDEGFAAHWQVTLRFLGIVTAVWPDWLREQGLMNPVARQVALLKAQGDYWAQNATDATSRLWAVGFTDALPATVEALRGILRHPNGLLVLPGLDLSMDEDTFAGLPDGHPQAGLSRLLASLDARRDDVALWPSVLPGAGATRAALADRARMIARTLLPASALGDWAQDQDRVNCAGLTRLTATDQQEEAAAIALALRAAIGQEGVRVALVTPDRGLAGRVSAELARWDILADDSAGELLIATPPAVLVRLLAQAIDQALAPVALLALLKHPLVACGTTPGACRASARLLERLLLRGPAPAPGFDGLRARVADMRADSAGLRPGASADRPDEPQPVDIFLDRLEGCLAPALAAARDARPLPDLLTALLTAAEALTATDDMSGADRLWRGEDGNALAHQLSDLLASGDVLPAQPWTVLDGLLCAVLTEERIQTRHALRGRGETMLTLHPRVFIWGLTEARLQTVDLMILGGLVESVWPPATDPGPWLSRPMRARVGLPSPELAIGQAAHDFASCIAAAGEVVLSAPGRLEGAPAVPARWLVRLDAFLAGRDQSLPEHPALSWLKQLDRPDGAPVAATPPSPRPPVARRPRRLSVTEIETWMRDPYAIYARHVLKLKPLDPLEQSVDASDYGSLVHGALDVWFREHGTNWPANAASRLRDVFLASLEDAGLRPALAAWWRPRLIRIAGWVAEAEAVRRREAVPRTIMTEAKGRATITDMPGGPFSLTGRADRIDIFDDGSTSILDYKTGSVPSNTAVVAGWNPQLPLEAAMLAAGGFAGVTAGPDGAAPLTVTELLYWRLTGGAEPGEQAAVTVKDGTIAELATEAWENLRARVTAYDQPDQPYLSHPHPGNEPRFADYAQLARVAEWSTAREDGAE